MPTFARLTAAVLLAILGVIVAELGKQHFEEGIQVHLFTPVAAAMGVLSGWTFLGKKLQRPSNNVTAIGLTGAVVQAGLTLLFFGITQMLKRAERMSYDHVMEAIVGIFESALYYLDIVLKPDVIVVGLIGGVVIGHITNWVARRTR